MIACRRTIHKQAEKETLALEYANARAKLRWCQGYDGNAPAPSTSGELVLVKVET
jgi:hypothetical protein